MRKLLGSPPPLSSGTTHTHPSRGPPLSQRCCCYPLAPPHLARAAQTSFHASSPAPTRIRTVATKPYPSALPIPACSTPLRKRVLAMTQRESPDTTTYRTGVRAAVRRGRRGAPERIPPWLTRTAETNSRGDALQALPCLQEKSSGGASIRRRAMQVSALTTAEVGREQGWGAEGRGQ